MTKIKLYRPIENFNKNCSYAIMVNGEKIADLKNGEEKSIEITDNLEKLTIKAKIHWCGSNHLSYSDLDKDSVIRITGNKFLNKQVPVLGAMLPLTGIILLSGYNELFKTIGFGIMSLLFAGLIGTLTIWKTKWLKIEKEPNKHYNKGSL